MLQLTEHTKKLLERGKREAATRDHNATVDAALECAKSGGIINLTDLMASHEKLVESEYDVDTS